MVNNLIFSINIDKENNLLYNIIKYRSKFIKVIIILEMYYCFLYLLYIG